LGWGAQPNFGGRRRGKILKEKNGGAEKKEQGL